MDIKIIKNPSRATKEILMHRIHFTEETKPERFDAIGLVQGKMIEMIVASDIAEKAVGVIAKDVHGNCPQNMILLAVFGETSSVEQAMVQIRDGVNSDTYDFGSSGF